jgi:trimeric autotransporter adhesin
MKILKKENIHAIVLSLAAMAVFALLASINACRASQFGFIKLDHLTITPADPVMAGGTQLQLSAIGVYSDGTTEDMTTSVNWTASDSMVTVSASGVATTAQVTSPETCIITATEPGGMSGSASLAVKNAQLTSIEVSPLSADIDGGTVVNLAATGTFVSSGETFTQDISSMATWSTSNDACATVDSGTVTGISGGTAGIMASWGNITSNEADITVSGISLVSLDINPKDKEVPCMWNTYFTATGRFSDGSVKDLTQSVTWSSSDTTVAVIKSYCEYGMIVNTPQRIAGSATISAKLGNMTASTSLIVSLTAPY